MIKKALGGDRVGSGKKNEIALHAFSRSTHNVTQITRTTQAVGTLVPIFNRLMLKDNKLDLDLNAILYTNPTEGPAFSEYELQIHVYSAPLRLYQAKLHMNMLEQGTKMNEIKFPQIEMTADKIDWSKDPDNQQINQSCLYQYLGTRGLGDALDPNTQTTVTRYREATPLLMYWDIYGNYYANQQEKIGVVIHGTGNVPGIINQITLWVPSLSDSVFIEESPATSDPAGNIQEGGYLVITFEDPAEPPRLDQIYIEFSDGSTETVNNIFYDILTTTGQIECYDPYNGFWGKNILRWRRPTPTDLLSGEPQLYTFPLTNLNEMRLDVLAAAKSTNPFVIDSDSIAPYGLALKKYGTVYAKTIAQEGLGIRTYKSDLFNNYLDSESIEEINERSKIITTDGFFTMETFLLKEKVFSYLNRIQLAGNTVDDWEEAAYGTQSRRPTEKPVFEGALHKRINFDEVVSTAPAEGKPLGTLAGTGKMSGDHRGGKVSIRVDEASRVMVIASLIPIIDYTQGNDWTGDLETYEDLHKPSFDRLGFQNLPTDWMATWDTKINAAGVKTYYSAGKQPSWIHYQTNINQDFGEFASQKSEGWMVNARIYEADTETRRIKDLTTYIDPVKWNNPFAYKSRSAQNWRMQYLIEAKQRITMSANQIPGL